ncbi:MAG: YihY/virulence factor BrkB family protein [Roseburia sp.]|nr:YihY/virulence factor BrkB family protein [Roseburia sp.]
MLHKLYRIGLDFSAKMKKQNISAFSASTAFFFFLSLVPMLIMLCTLIPYTPLTEENLMMVVRDVVPERIAPLIEDLITEVYEESAGILSVAVIATLWSAGKGVLALMRGLNAINDVEEKRNYFVVRLVASLYTALMLVVMLLSLVVMIFGNQLVDMALYRIPQLKVLVEFLMCFRFLAVWVILTYIFAAIYAFVPDKKQRFREQIPGASFAAMVWGVFSWGFSLYVDWADYSIYGSLSIIILVMLWMYFCMYIILVGAYLNNYFKPVNQVFVGSLEKHTSEKK